MSKSNPQNSDVSKDLSAVHAPEELPPGSWSSTWSVLAIQTQNAFNDNMVKFVLVGLALVVAKGTMIGNNIEIITSSIIPIPFVLLAPLAGYVADRFSKRSVMWVCLIAQTMIFAFIWFGLMAKDIRIALLGFVLLSIQSTFFSPAKLGVVKELVGSRKLGMVAGWMGMTSMLAILAGIAAGGKLFSKFYAESGDAWSVAAKLVLWVGLLSLLPLVLALIVKRTPSHPEVKFRLPLLWEHFVHLKSAMSIRAQRVTMLALAFFWFVCYLIGLFTINLGSELHPQDGGKAAASASMMSAMMGVGLIVGSLVVSFISRRGIALWLVPIGACGLGLGVLLTALCPLGSTSFFGFFVVIGLFGGAFNVPLTAYLQDLPAAEKRGSVLAANNLLTSMAGLIAGAVVLGLKNAGIATTTQMLVIVAPIFVVAFFLWRKPPNAGTRIQSE